MGPKSRWGPDRLCQTRLIPRSPDGDKNSQKVEFATIIGGTCRYSLIHAVANCSGNHFLSRFITFLTVLNFNRTTSIDDIY